MLELSTIISLTSVGIAVGNVLYTRRRDATLDSKKIWEAISAQNTEIALLKKQGDLFWGLIEQQMAKALIRPTHIELDELLHKVVKGLPLTADQETRLAQMLHDTVNDKREVAGVRAMAAAILAIRLARQEAQLQKPCD